MNELEVRAIVHDDAESLREEPMIVSVGIEVCVDGQPVEDVRWGYAFSLENLLESVATAGEYFIITCGCGYPGDKGIERGVVVSIESDVVSWFVPEPPPQRQFIFARPAYEEAVRLGAEAAREAFSAAVAKYPEFEVGAIPYPEEHLYRAG
jgi:hypothetical protein